MKEKKIILKVDNYYYFTYYLLICIITNRTPAIEKEQINKYLLKKLEISYSHNLFYFYKKILINLYGIALPTYISDSCIVI